MVDRKKPSRIVKTAGSTPAWQYFRIPRAYARADESFAPLRQLARSLDGYAEAEAAHKNYAEGARAASDAIAMGLKICGDWPVEDKPGEDAVLLPLVGVAISQFGYQELENVYSGDGARLARARANRAAFMRRFQEFYAAMRSHMDSNVFDSY